MLCEEIEINGTLKQYGLDGARVTQAYREAIAEELKSCEAQGDLAERKWDGTRVIAKGNGSEVILQNREGRIYTRRLPDVVEAFSHYIHGCWVIDGEIVSIKDGQEQFTPQQRRCRTEYPEQSFIKQIPLNFEAFDLLSINGQNIETEPYFERKIKLLNLFSKLTTNFQPLKDYMNDEVVKYVPYERDLQKAWKQVIQKDWEGLIVKDKLSAYEHKRSWKWRKVKNWKWEVCHVVGYTPGIRARSSFFGALVLENSEGQYRGLVGSGFSEWDLRRFKNLFTDSPSMDKPFSDSQVGSHYTAKKVATEVLVKYYQLTESGVMRFSTYYMG